MITLTPKISQYTIGDVIIALLLYKTITHNAELKTMVMIAAIRVEMQGLDTKMIALQITV